MKEQTRKMVSANTFTSGANTSVNIDARTAQLIFSTGAKGLRDGSYYEELSMESNHVDLSRLNSGAPLLANHDSSSLNSVIGVVENAYIANGQGIATVRFSADPEADRIFQKVIEGVIRNVSIGYTINKYETKTKPGDKFQTLRAIDWAIYEISLVTIPFDKNAQIRTQNKEITDVQIIEQKDTENMKEKQQILQEERTRQNEIRLAVRTAKLDESFSDELVASDITVDEARKRIFSKMAETKQEPTINNTVRVEVGQSSDEKQRDGLVDAISNRITSGVKATGAAKMFEGRSLISCIESHYGRKLGEQNQSLARRAMSTSDLPLILAASAEKSVAYLYSTLPRSYTQFVKEDVLRNYKQHSRVKSSDFGSLILRNEGAEYAQSTLSEEQELISLKDYGVIHAFTSQMLVNDDLSVLKDLVTRGAQSAGRLDNSLVYSALQSTANMQDGIPLFHATHNNLATAGAINETTLGEMFKLMRKQKSVGGLEVLNIAPKFLICGPDQEVAARKVLASITPNQSSLVNPFSNTLELIIDAEIIGNQFYLAAAPSTVDTITIYRLQGNETPVVQSRVNFNTDDFEIKVSHAVVAKAMDYRGLVKNPGL